MEAAAQPRPTFAQASRELLRETVLDAVGELAAFQPWADVTMTDVAERAGVSRQTLYNAFGSRQELMQAYALREAERFLADTRDAIRAHAPDPRAALDAALRVFLSAAATHPVIRAMIASDDGDELLPLLTTRGAPLVGVVRDRLADELVAQWPTVARADAELVSDCLVRLAISHAVLPSAAPAETSGAVARILGPYVDHLTNG
jgi:AcrR family transcriptional regulator